MLTKIFIRTFPSTEECELFESLLKTRWPSLLEDVKGVVFNAYKNPTQNNILTVVWEFPDMETQKKVEKLIEENITKFTQTLSPKTMSFTGEQVFHIST
jgi:hypothetical protein